MAGREPRTGANARGRSWLLVAALLLAACSSPPTAGEGGRVSGTLTDVVEVGDGAVLRLEGVRSSVYYYRRMLVDVRRDTEIFVTRAGGERVKGELSDLVPRMRIEAFYEGLAMYSYPPRVRASRIEVRAAGPLAP